MPKFCNVEEIHVVCADGDGIETWHAAAEENFGFCAPQHVYFIDGDGGRMINSIELDKMCNKRLVEAYAAEGPGYDYFTG